MDTFKDSYVEFINLFVGKSVVDAYLAVEPWMNFKSIEGIDVPKPLYKVLYYVDGKLYKTVLWREGDTIIPEPAPTKDGYKFGGWEDIPEVMPGNMIYVHGKFVSYNCDVNGDGRVNGTDIQAVINMIVDEDYAEEADVNQDHKVNGTDIQEIINKIVGEE